MKRLFIAVDISDQARNLAAKYISKLQAEVADLRVGWERPEKLHTTLKFLGRTEEDRISAITSSLTGIARKSEPFRLSIGGQGVFPSPLNPRVLWLGIVDAQGKLDELANKVIVEMAELGFETEKRRFKAHLTIARIKEPEKARVLAAKHLQSVFEPLEFEIGEIVLYESQLRPTGSFYSKLASFPLASR